MSVSTLIPLTYYVDGQYATAQNLNFPLTQISSNLDILNNDKTSNISTDTNIMVSSGLSNGWFKYFTAFTGALCIELTNLYNLSIPGRMKLNISSINAPDYEFIISSVWNSSSHSWTDSEVLMLSSSTNSYNVRFCKNTTTSKCYILIGEITTNFPESRVTISDLISGTELTNYGFSLSSINSLTGLTTDLTVQPIQYVPLNSNFILDLGTL